MDVHTHTLIYTHNHKGDAAAEGEVEGEASGAPLVWVKHGSLVKEQVDLVLDQCSELTHLRQVIVFCFVFFTFL
jgi:hypothetical protein